jgi:AraC-like DNA-binding protein
LTVRFDLEPLDPADRAEAVRAVSQQENGKIEVRVPPDPARIRAVMTVSMLGPVQVAKIDWNVAALKRTAGPRDDDIEPQVFLGFQESGVSRTAQRGRQAEIGPGEIVIVETARPYDIVFNGPIKTVAVRVPMGVLGLPSALLGQLTAVRLGPDRPVTGAATVFFSHLARRQPAVGGTEASLLAQPGIDLIRAMVATGLGHDDLAKGPLHDTLLERVMAYLRLHLAEHDLTAARIAADHHVSVRQLYLVLSRAGISLGDWIRSERLAECKRQLASPAHQHLTIETTAYQWGFASAAHFSRVFKAAYGMSPGEWRRSSRSPGGEGKASVPGP